MSDCPWSLHWHKEPNIVLPAPRSPVVCPSAQTEPGYRKHWYKELDDLRKQDDNTTGLELVLDVLLADDERNEGIVWACHPSGREDIKLVLKIFDYDDLVYSDRSEWTIDYPEITFWAGEQFAYEHLKLEQGKLLPYDYGFYEMFHEGRKVCSHLMERIEGIHIDYDLLTGTQQKLQKPQWQKLAEVFLQAVLSLHDADIMHGDLGEHNVLILNYQELLADSAASKRPEMVFIDWSRAARISEAKNSPRNHEGKSFWHILLWKHALDLSRLKNGGFLCRSLAWIDGPGQDLWNRCYMVE